jgi:hypothetical protein
VSSVILGVSCKFFFLRGHTSNKGMVGTSVRVETMPRGSLWAAGYRLWSHGLISWPCDPRSEAAQQAAEVPC